MLSKISNSLFETRAQALQKAKTRKHHFVSYDKAKTVFILFECNLSEVNPLIIEIIKLLQADGKKVTALGYIHKKEPVTLVLPGLRIINAKDVDVFGKPKQAHLHELETIQFDLFLDFSLHSVLPLRYMALYVNAHFNAGTRVERTSLYDFILDIDQLMSTMDQEESTIDEKYLFDQIVFYLKRIQTKD